MLTRRSFFQQTGIIAAGLTLSRLQAIAGPFAPGELDANNIPIDKKLDPKWVKSLYERGTTTKYLKSRNELRYIGMPVGGINAGGVYLGGDGRLWLWDIFNDNQEGVEPKVVPMDEGEKRKQVRSRDGACYVEPAKDVRPLKQGFLIKVEWEGKTVIKSLEENDWDEIEFEAGYPIGTVRYTDKSLPVNITLHAYSPFIPLDENSSGIPATILTIRVKNKELTAVKVTITGYLENKTGIRSARNTLNRRANEAKAELNMVAVLESLEIMNEKSRDMEQNADFGTMCIAALGSNNKSYPDFNPETMTGGEATDVKATKPIQESLVGAVETTLSVKAEGSARADFIISWHFPNLKIDPNRIKDNGRYYQNEHTSALEVAQYIRDNFEQLSSKTRLWSRTWRDSTLPYWFLERTLMTADTLATTNCHRFSSGRFWAWEGVGCCGGTCTHVWQYAHSVGRLFPALERDTRERVDLGIAMEENGGIIFRAEEESRPAIDGQAGTVLRIYREHQMTGNNDFLKRNWEKIKKAVEFILNQDKNGDGMEDTPMENTLDAVWDGEIAWIVGLCIAGVRAGQAMAEEMSDTVFAKRCADYVKKGSANMDKYLFNGEYYIHRPDKEKGRAKLGSYNTCHIDQVFGQSWAHQVGLGYIQDPKKVKLALQSLWKYNYTPDVGPYIAVHKGGRPYALAGEGGMVMNTNPKNEDKPYGDNVTWQLGYFHECMSGFEYQVAAHMLAEGMIDEGLVLVRSIHDRYHASKRNPYNEIECSDHYARAMASYGAFITACGFEYHGPKGYMRFAPKWNADKFKTPFTAAEGWGTYSQEYIPSGMECVLQPNYGQVQLVSFSIDAPVGKRFKSAEVLLGGQKMPVKMKQEGQKVLLTFENRITVKEGQQLSIKL